jgi:hypothetical protein
VAAADSLVGSGEAVSSLRSLIALASEKGPFSVVAVMLGSVIGVIFEGAAAAAAVVMSSSVSSSRTVASDYCCLVPCLCLRH